MKHRKKIGLWALAVAVAVGALSLLPESSTTSPTKYEVASAGDAATVVASVGARFDYQRIKSSLDDREPMTLDELHGQVRDVVGDAAAPVLEQLVEQERAWDQVREQQQRVHAQLAAAIRASDDRENDPEIAHLDARNTELLEELATTTERISALTAEVTAMYEEAMYAQLND